ncbi:MAG: DUF4352 domain-containing protein [Mycobacterium sp.]|nr:DUF4352 domain-containing protein [Mycobacterium sp.]
MTEPGWYADPSGAPGQRYFDGSQWTDRAPEDQPPKKSKKRWVLVGGVLALIVFFGGCGAILISRDTQEDEDSQRPAATAQADPTVAPAGSAARDGNFEFRILKIGQAETLEGLTDDPNISMTADGLYVVVTLTVENIGDEPASFSGRDQKIIDVDGREFGVDSEAEAYVNSGYDYSGPLSPGDSIEVDLPFDVPPDGKVDMMELRDSASSAGVELELPWN